MMEDVKEGDFTLDDLHIEENVEERHNRYARPKRDSILQPAVFHSAKSGEAAADPHDEGIEMAALPSLDDLDTIAPTQAEAELPFHQNEDPAEPLPSTTRPLKIANCVTKCPVFIAFISLAIAIVLAAIELEPNLKLDWNNAALPESLSITRSPWAVPDHPPTQKYDSWVFAQKDIKNISDFNNFSPETSLTIVYEAMHDNNLLNSAVLQLIHEIEQHIYSLTDFSSYCLQCQDDFSPFYPSSLYFGCETGTNSSSSCLPILSPLSMFFPTIITNETISNSTDINNTIPITNTQYVWNGQGNSLINISLAIDFFNHLDSKDDSNSSSLFFFGKKLQGPDDQIKFIRTQIRFALPAISSHNSSDTNQKEIEKLVEEFATRIREDVLDSYKDQLRANNIEIRYVGGTLFVESIVDHETWVNGWLIGGAFGFYLLIMLFQLRSLALLFFGVFQILISFPNGLFWTRYVIGVYYLDYTHLISLIVLLGLGGIYLVVLHKSFFKVYENDIVSVEVRLAHTYRTAGKSVFWSGLAASVTLISAYYPPFPPVRSLGLLLGISIFVNTLLSLFFFVALLTIQLRYIERVANSCRGKCKCCQKSVSHTWYKSSSNRTPGISLKHKRSFDELVVAGSFRSPFQGPSKRELQSAPCVERWLECPPAFYFIFLLIWFGWTGYTAYRCSFLNEASEGTVPLRSGPLHDYHDFLQSHRDLEGLAESVEVVFVLGVDSEPDRMGKVGWKYGSPSCDYGACGQAQYNKFKFDEEAQLLLLDLCDQATNQTWFYKENNCFIRQFKEWLESGSSAQVRPRFPASASVAVEALLEFTQQSPQYISQKKIYFENENLKYVSLSFYSKFKQRQTYDSAYLNDVQSELDDWTQTFRDQGLKIWYTTSPSSLFIQLDLVEEVYVHAILNVVGCIIIYSIAITLSTANILVALYGIVVFISVVICTIGTFELLGWKISQNEIICGLITVAVAGESVMHLANFYIYNEESRRQAASKRAIFDLLVPLCFATIAIMGACVFMFVSNIQPIYVFGIFIFTTFGYSLLATFTFLAGLLLFIGPSDDLCGFFCLCNVCFCGALKKFQGRGDRWDEPIKKNIAKDLNRINGESGDVNDPISPFKPQLPAHSAVDVPIIEGADRDQVQAQGGFHEEDTAY